MHVPTIVYVEDNIGDVLLLRQAFEECFFNVDVDVIPDGAQALRYLQVKATAKDAPPPDLILLDMRLPKVDGDELWKFIAEDPYLQGIPTFIFLSGPVKTDLTIPQDRRLTKPAAWDGYTSLVARMMAQIEDRRKTGR